ncbi:hypothetical protein TeGR_g9727 [Tetraparma gracilis]|uniref:Propionyl-CoA carboxylase beta chain, mitochondrial n=1 Tax=Tetraparma gracilis TaxID=2962635 RepID=A0ABQ6M3K0_9STRA|nr:hypothetical protein TeGR_g9727 [Tetraparma gracilis]
MQRLLTRQAPRWVGRGLSTVSLRSPVTGTIVKLPSPGDYLKAGEEAAIMESMKMEIAVEAPLTGVVLASPRHAAGDVVEEGEVLFKIREEAEPEVPIADHASLCSTPSSPSSPSSPSTASSALRSDLSALHARLDLLQDSARPKAVERRRSRGQLTARESIARLCDPGTFSEYGGLAIAAQRRTRKVEDLVQTTQADGVVTGVGKIEGSTAVIVAVDATVMAGTQGFFHHSKIDRAVEVATKQNLPVVVLPEGGGGRPNDSDMEGLMAAGLHLNTWTAYSRLAGIVPRVAVVSGYCFAGSAAIAGTSDVVIATSKASIGMGGPAMIEGGGLGVVTPDEVGPAHELYAAGAVDLVVDDDEAAMEAAKRYLSYFLRPHTGEREGGNDQELLRDVIPENRKRAYDVRELIDVLFDRESVMELRRPFGGAVTTSLARLNGRAVGVIANDPKRNGGAVDADAAEKSAKFMRLCDAFGLPLITLVDTPGFMVGPAAEKTALMRKASRLFLAGASLTVPIVSVITRKAVGLGAMAMCGGSTKVPVECLAWPSAEIGAMGTEGAVTLGFKKELAEAEEKGGKEGRQTLFDKLCTVAHKRSAATNAASLLEVDDVIDPKDTRKRLVLCLEGVPISDGGGKGGLDSW